MVSRTLLLMAMVVVVSATQLDLYEPVQICSSVELADFIQELCKTPVRRPQKRVLFGAISAREFAEMCCSKSCYPLQFIHFC